MATQPGFNPQSPASAGGGIPQQQTGWGPHGTSAVPSWYSNPAGEGMPPVSQTGSSGGTGQFPTGSAGPLYSLKTGGYGIMPAGAAPWRQMLMANASAQRWGGLKFGGPPGLGDRAETEALAPDPNEKLNYGPEWVAQQQQMQMGDLRLEAGKKLLSLFGGMTGGTGGGGMGPNVPMPIPIDPRIEAAQQIKVKSAYEPLRRQLALSRGQRGMGIGTSSNATNQEAMLAGREAESMTESYLPGLQASAAAYQPGLRAAEIGQNWPQLLMRLFGQFVGGRG